MREIIIVKKSIKRILAIILVAVLLTSILAGCRRSQNGIFEPPEFVFVPEIISLPDELQHISDLIYSNNKLFFTSYVILDEMTWETAFRIYSVNLDGTNLSYFENFVPFEVPTFDDDNAYGGSYIRQMMADNEGNLWVFEEWSVDSYNEQTYEHRTLGRGYVLSKLDDSGVKISSIDLASLGSNDDYFWLQSVNMDGSGNIYASISDMNGFILYVLDSNGDIMFKLDDLSWGQLMRTPDGRMAYFGYIDSLQKNALQFIDVAARAFGEAVELPQNVWEVYPGTGDYTFLYRRENSIFGFNAETDESVRLLNWLESNVIPNSIGNITVLPDGRIVCTNGSSNMITGQWTVELLILTRIPYSDLPERIVITLASASLQMSLLNQIVQFNRTNLQYRIHVIDYSEFNNEDDWGAGIKRLSTDIIAGNIPDILDVTGLPVAQYAARGLLEDLYPFIDADPELSRSGLVEAVLRASEFDGNLYRIFPSFVVDTIIGHPSVVGPYEGWNMAEFREVLDANPQADMPMGSWLTKDQFIRAAMTINMDQFIDWESGRVHFDTGEYAQLLEFANRFPAEFIWDDDMMWQGPDQLIASGRQIMMWTSLWDFDSFKWQRDMFGGDVVFKGFPTESRHGSSFTAYTGLAMTTRASNKDAAWGFIREFLTSDWQRANINWLYGMPMNKEVFDEIAAESMIERDYWGGPIRPMPARTVVVDAPDVDVDIDVDIDIDNDHDGDLDDGWGDDWWFPQDRPLTQEEVDQIINLINSVTNFTSTNEELMNIIMEDASDFFSGLRNAQDTARITQSRVSRLIAEQS